MVLEDALRVNFFFFVEKMPCNERVNQPAVFLTPIFLLQSLRRCRVKTTPASVNRRLRMVMIVRWTVSHVPSITTCWLSEVRRVT